LTKILFEFTEYLILPDNARADLQVARDYSPVLDQEEEFADALAMLEQHVRSLEDEVGE